MGLLNTLRYIWRHPLNKGAKVKSMSRFLRWQIGSRLVRSPVAVEFVDEARLLIATGMHGATMSIYTGLQEFEDMSFVLHFLRVNDVFVDVGANVGIYTILASGVAGAKSFSIEPVPSSYNRLMDNVHLNNLAGKVKALNIALGQELGELSFTADQDTVNHVVASNEVGTKVINVPVNTLNNVLQGQAPNLIKIDVEGYETIVIAGGKDVLAQESLFGVIMELNGSGSRYGFSEELLHNTMLEYGFSTFAYLPIERKLIPLEGKNNMSGNTLYLRHIDVVMERVKSAKSFVIHQSGSVI